MIVFCISMHIHCMSNHLLVCLPIILSVCPSFCPSVYPSVHPYVCSHIVKMAKFIAKSSKINLKSMVQFHGNKSSMKWKRYWKENCIEKPHRCLYKLATRKWTPLISALEWRILLEWNVMIDQALIGFQWRTEHLHQIASWLTAAQIQLQLPN